MARIEDILSGRLNTHNAPTGTRAAGYSPPDCGPFRCDNCLHYSHDACNQPVVMADKELEHNAHGDAIVEDGGCCTYFRNKKKRGE